MGPRIAPRRLPVNRFGRMAVEADLAATGALPYGDALPDDARWAASRMCGELPGLLAAMDARDAWKRLPRPVIALDATVARTPPA